jgi:uncharacterized protein (DUF433 family)
MTEKALLRRIVIDPTIMLGKPVIRGTRLDDIRAALLYAAKSVAHEEIYAA